MDKFEIEYNNRMNRYNGELWRNREVDISKRLEKFSKDRNSKPSITAKPTRRKINVPNENFRNPHTSQIDRSLNQNVNKQRLIFNQGSLHDNIFFQKIGGNKDKAKYQHKNKLLSNSHGESFMKSFNDKLQQVQKKKKLKINPESTQSKNMQK